MHITEQARQLYEALLQKGVKAELEYWDGHKHVDIAILEAKIFVEVDGLPHFLNPDQIERDFHRSHYSDEDSIGTFHVPNILVEQRRDEVADAIARLVNKRLGAVGSHEYRKTDS